MPILLIILVLLVLGAVVGTIYIGILLLIMLVAGVWVLSLPPSDSNRDAEWIGKKRKEGALELAFPFAGAAAGLGAVVGFFRGCDVASGSIDFAT